MYKKTSNQPWDNRAGILAVNDPTAFFAWVDYTFRLTARLPMDTLLEAISNRDHFMTLRDMDERTNILISRIRDSENHAMSMKKEYLDALRRNTNSLCEIFERMIKSEKIRIFDERLLRPFASVASYNDVVGQMLVLRIANHAIMPGLITIHYPVRDILQTDRSTIDWFKISKDLQLIRIREPIPFVKCDKLSQLVGS